MNLPTPTPRTDEQINGKPCTRFGLLAGDSLRNALVAADFARTLERELIALTGTHTCTHHNDQQRAACPVCLVTALTAERNQLRADCENETKWAAHYLAQSIADKARAEKAEAELTAERARLDYLGLHMGTRMVAEALNCDYSKCFPIRDAIDLAMKGTP